MNKQNAMDFLPEISKTMFFLLIKNKNETLTPAYVRKELSYISENVIPFIKKELRAAYLRYLVISLILMSLGVLSLRGYGDNTILFMILFIFALSLYFIYDFFKQMAFLREMNKHQTVWGILKEIPENDFLLLIQIANESFDEKKAQQERLQ